MINYEWVSNLLSLCVVFPSHRVSLLVDEHYTVDLVIVQVKRDHYLAKTFLGHISP